MNESGKRFQQDMYMELIIYVSWTQFCVRFTCIELQLFSLFSSSGEFAANKSPWKWSKRLCLPNFARCVLPETCRDSLQSGGDKWCSLTFEPKFGLIDIYVMFIWTATGNCNYLAIQLNSKLNARRTFKLEYFYVITAKLQLKSNRKSN